MINKLEKKLKNISLNTKTEFKIWSEIKILLKKEIGETMFRNWILPLELENVKGGTVIFSSNSDLVIDRVERFYSERIIYLWKSFNKDLIRIKLYHKFQKENFQKENSSDTSKKDILEDENFNDNIIFESRLDNRLSFENFIIGPSNELACAAAKRVANFKKISFNPLFLYGGVGLGKTHLLNSIALEIGNNYPNKKVIYMSAEKFMYVFVKSLQSNNAINFKESFRSVDVLLIDDIQFISSKEKTREEFFHTFNELIEKGCQIVLSADKSPNEIKDFDDRLRSRLGWGLVTDIHQTNYKLRLKILKSKINKISTKIPDNVLEFIAHKVKSNVRELEGALNRIIAHSTLVNSKVTIEKAYTILKDILKANEKQLSINDIQKIVANHFSVKISEMLSSRRSRSLVIPRQIAMYLCKELTHFSYPEIGRNFGGRDHTTVIYASNKIEDYIKNDSKISEDINIIKAQF